MKKNILYILTITALIIGAIGLGVGIYGIKVQDFPIIPIFLNGRVYELRDTYIADVEGFYSSNNRTFTKLDFYLNDGEFIIVTLDIKGKPYGNPGGRIRYSCSVDNEGITGLTNMEIYDDEEFVYNIAVYDFGQYEESDTGQHSVTINGAQCYNTMELDIYLKIRII